MKHFTRIVRSMIPNFMHLVLAISCISYTTFLTSSQPMMMPGGMGGMGAQPPLPPLTEADIAELENLYQSLTANMTQEEKDMLQKMGEDLMNQYTGPQQQPQQKPEAQKPLPQKPTLPPLRPETGEKIPEVSQFAPLTPQQQRHIEKELNTIITNLTNLQTMIGASPDFANALRQWRTDINEMLYSLKVINKPEHHVRLNAPEFARLLKTIEHLNTVFNHKAFSDACSHTEGCKAEVFEDPYATLGVSPTASQKQIDDAYKKLEKKFKQTKEQIKLKGLTEPEQKKALRNAQYSFDLIRNAYDLIKDPKMRAVLNKERHAKQAAQQSMHQSIRQLLTTLNQELGMAIYNNQFLNDLDTFLKKYEPAQLEARKKMEQSEAERLKELKEQEARKPIGKLVTVGKDQRSSWEMPWYQQGGGYGYPYGGGTGGGYHPTPAGPQPGLGGSQTKPGTEAAKPLGYSGTTTPEAEEKGGKAAGTEADKKAAEAKDKGKSGSGPKKEELITDKTVMDIYDLDRTLKKFNSLFERDYFIKTIGAKEQDGALTELPKEVVFTPDTKEQIKAKINTIYEENEPTPNDLLEKVDAIKEAVDDAEEKLKKSYQHAWNDMQNRKPFESNMSLLQTALQSLTKDEQARVRQTEEAATKRTAEPTPKVEKSQPLKLYETMQTLQKRFGDFNTLFKTEEAEKKKAEKKKKA